MKFFVLILLLSSCSSAVHLKKAERQIKKAEQKGATWKSDTTFKVIQLKTDPVKVQFEPKPLIFNDTIYFRDTVTRVETKVIVKQNETVLASTNCPETIKYVKVPITVHRTIKAKIPITWWDLIVAVIIALGVGYVIRMLWVK